MDVRDHLRDALRTALAEAGVDVNLIDDVGGCTLTAPESWFSYRASRAEEAPDYGRNLSAITAPQG